MILNQIELYYLKEKLLIFWPGRCQVSLVSYNISVISTFVVCLVVQSLSHVWLCNPWTVTFQSPLSRGFSRPECWNGLPCPPPWDLPNPGIELRSPTLQADSLQSGPPGKPKNTGAGSLFLLQGSLPNPGIKPGSPALQVVSLPAELPGKRVSIFTGL